MRSCNHIKQILFITKRKIRFRDRTGNICEIKIKKLKKILNSADKSILLENLNRIKIEGEGLSIKIENKSELYFDPDTIKEYSKQVKNYTPYNMIPRVKKILWILKSKIFYLDFKNQICVFDVNKLKQDNISDYIRKNIKRVKVKYGGFCWEINSEDDELCIGKDTIWDLSDKIFNIL